MFACCSKVTDKIMRFGTVAEPETANQKCIDISAHPDKDDIIRHRIKYKMNATQDAIISSGKKTRDEKLNDHITTYASLLAAEGYTGDLNDLSEIDTYLTGLFDAANAAEKDRLAFASSRILARFVASLYYGNQGDDN